MPSNKRKSELIQDRPLKKQRSENSTSSHEAHSQGSPELPPILPKYEKAVFTHASMVPQAPSTGEMVHYERLEFLGDAQLEHIASLVIFERYVTSTPGKMSTIREALVKNDTLSKFSRLYRFDKLLKISLGVEQPRDWNKILGDVFEAYVAAVILSDSNPHTGFDTARKWLTKLWEPMFASLGLKIMAPPDVKSKDTLGKTVLVAGIKLSYIDEKPPMMVKSKGLTTYFIGVYLTGWGYDNQHLGSGQGNGKSEAGQEAARNALNNPLLDDVKAKRAAFLEQKAKDEASEANRAVLVTTKDEKVV